MLIYVNPSVIPHILVLFIKFTVVCLPKQENQGTSQKVSLKITLQRGRDPKNSHEHSPKNEPLPWPIWLGS